MVKSKRSTIRDAELLSRILELLKTKECLTSEFYGLSNPIRIDSLIKRLMESGLIQYRLKEEGQRRPLYSLTKSGELFLLVNRMYNDCLDNGIRPDDPWAEDVFNLLNQRYDSPMFEEPSTISE